MRSQDCVYVGLSGGVDSAVSAALLKEQGYDVVGAFIKIWRPEFTECTWKEDRQDAMRVCAALSIPFREIDLSDEYKREVVDCMVADYARGITPNPDVLCNRSIKFGSFFKWARESGADFVATGHYARIGTPDNEYFGFRKPKYLGLRNPNILMRGIDVGKDQSYFLHQLRVEDLPRIIFPVGDMRKSDVRAAAAHFDLPVAKRPDSQGLCFLGDISIPEFLSHFITVAPGNVVNMRGAVVGRHDGAALYTIGQRHGFTAHGNVPHYVVATDIHANTIRVSANREDAAVKKVKIRDMRWMAKPALPFEALVQTRYREMPVGATIEEGNGTFIARFNEPHIAAPGQSIVLYDGSRCLGGGIVDI